MTSTTVINTQSFGTGSNVGETLYPSVFDHDASTVQAIVNVSVTLVSAASNQSSRLNVRYAWSPTAYSSPLAGALALKGASKYVEVLLSPTTASAVVERSSLPIVALAGYTYLWIEAPTLPAAATVTVKIVESTQSGT